MSVPIHGHNLKEDELRQLATCANCHRKIGEVKVLTLWKVTFERHILEQDALRRQTALGVMLGSGHLASVMGPNEDMTEILVPPRTVMICEKCACAGINLAAIEETTRPKSSNEPE